MRARSSSGSPPRPRARRQPSSWPRRTPQPVRDELITALITRIRAQGGVGRGRDHARLGLAPRRGRRRGRRGAVPRPVAGLQRAAHLDRRPRPVARRPDRRAQDAGPGRQHGERRGRLPADAPGRGRDPGRRRPGRGLHHPRGARHRRAAGDRHARVRRRARRVLRARPAATSRSSPTAACRPAATLPRRSPAAPTRSCSARRSPGAPRRPAAGINWGMAAPSPTLPRGTRIKVGERRPLEQILFGPTSLTNGTQNLVGALRQSMGALGAADDPRDARGRDGDRPGDQDRGQELAARRPRIGRRRAGRRRLTGTMRGCPPYGVRSASGCSSAGVQLLRPVDRRRARRGRRRPHRHALGTVPGRGAGA